MDLVLDEEPRAQARARTFVAGGKTITYDPLSKEKEYTKWLIQSEYVEAINSLDKEIAMEASKIASSELFFVGLYLYCLPPKNSTVAHLNRVSWGLVSKATKPDVDNYAKYYLDCMSGLVFPDDSRVVCLNVRKYYSNQPKVVIRIMTEDKKSLHEKAFKILSSISKEAFCELAEKLWITARYLDSNSECNSEPPEQYQLAAASVLSEFADRYGPYLAKVAKNYPALSQELQNLEECKAALHRNQIPMEGKPLC